MSHPTKQRPAGNRASQVTGQGDIGSVAREYAEAGLAPIRVYGVNDDGSCRCRDGAACTKKPGKHPVGNGWQNAPIDASAVTAWLRCGGNVGLRMGEQPGGFSLVAIDEDEEGAIKRAELELGELPPTLTACSGSGGQHRVFEWPEGVPLPRNQVKPRQGIDIRSQGGQIVVSPSKHYSGQQYRWSDWRAPEMLPEAWVAALAAPSEREPRERRQPSGAPGDDARDTALAALLGAHWPPAGVKYGRHDDSRAWGSVLAQRGLSDARIERIVRTACMGRTDQVDGRISQAKEAADQARRFQRGERKPNGDMYEQPIGFDHLSARYGDEYTRAIDALTPKLSDQMLAGIEARKKPRSRRQSEVDEWIEKTMARTRKVKS